MKSLVVPVLPAEGRPKRPGAYTRAELNDFLQHGDHSACDVGLDDVVHSGMRLLEQGAIVRRHLANHVRVDADAVRGENREGRSVLEEIQVRGAESERQIWRQGLVMPKRRAVSITLLMPIFSVSLTAGTLREPASARRSVMRPSNFSS